MPTIDGGSAPLELSISQKVEIIARVGHEANRAWCEAHADRSQRPWTLAGEWQRESMLRGVEVALEGAGPKAQHEAWRQAKIAEGWTFGDVKDAEAKTHPCLVPHEELPEMQRVKDELFIGIVAVLAPVFGLGH